MCPQDMFFAILFYLQLALVIGLGIWGVKVRRPSTLLSLACLLAFLRATVHAGLKNIHELCLFARVFLLSPGLACARVL